MKKSYRAIREICVAGKTIDVTLKLSSGTHTEKRKQKRNITREKVRENNDRMAARNLARLLNANFHENDFHVTLTYKGEAPSQEQAKKDRAAFIRKMRKMVPDLKYVAVTEWQHTRIHHHLVLSGCTLDQIDKLWEDKGFIKPVLLDHTGDYSQLADYLIKETTKTFRREDSGYKRRYSCSNNLIRPVVKREEISISDLFEDPEPIPGYYIPKDSIRRYEHPVTGIEHLEYIMVALGEPRKYKVWPRGRKVKPTEYFRHNYEESQEDIFDLVDF